MKKNTQDFKIKRGRGRPKGSHHFLNDDIKVCEKAADYIIKHPGTKPTAAFRKQGYNSESTLHRLRRNFKENKERYLTDAQSRYNAKLDLGLIGQATSFFEVVGDWVDIICRVAPVEFLHEEITKGKSNSSALKTLGMRPEPPFDIEDPNKLASVIAKFENRQFKSSDDLIGTEPYQNIFYHKSNNLKPYPGNARTHSKKQIKQIASSMKRFGFTNPLLIDEKEMVLAGHGRLEAAKLLGLTEVPCVLLSDMTEAEKRAYILADNKLAQNAGWNESILATELEYLIEQVDEVDLSLTGFTIAEVDEILEIGGTDLATESEEDDKLSEVSDDVLVTRVGDIWQMGSHRLVCGDAREINSYAQLLTNKDGISELAEMVFTDPPYNVKIDRNVCGSGNIKHSEFAMASGEMKPHEFIEFLKSTFDLLAKCSSKGSIHFICMDWRHISELLAAGNQTYSEFKNLCVWVKDNGGMGSFYRSRHELVFVFKNGDAPHINTLIRLN